MKIPNPYLSYVFLVVLAVTVLFVASETWKALVQGEAFDTVLVVSALSVLVSLYVVGRYANGSREWSS